MLILGGMTVERTSRNELSKDTLDHLVSHLQSQETKPPRYQGSLLPIQAINIARQPRVTFENIENLAQDIALKGVLNPPTVAKLTETGLAKHLEVLNFLWKTNHKIEDFVSIEENSEKIYYVLLAGERRTRASKHLVEKGCQLCQETFGAGGCYERHHPQLCKEGLPLVEVRLCNNIDTLGALFIQFSENTHMRVPPHEEARAYNYLFKLLREIDPKYPLAKFARQVGRSPETIKHAVMFCDLPNTIQELVENKKIAYGIACELARLQKEAGIQEERLMAWTIDAIIKTTPVPDFRKKVAEHIKVINSGQTIMNFFEEAKENAMRRASRKRALKGNQMGVHWSQHNYWRDFNDLVESGILGQEDSPYSTRSPIRFYLAQIAEMKRSLPFLVNLTSKNKGDDAQEALAAVGKVLEDLLSRVPEDEPVDENIIYISEKLLAKSSSNGH